MAQIIPSNAHKQPLSQDLLDSLNVAQEADNNKKNLDNIGGTNGLAEMLKVNLETGLTLAQVEEYREVYGPNKFPESPMKSFFQLYVESFNDTTLIILIIAAVVSLVVGYIEDPEKGWIEGVAILIAVQIVAVVTATNDYSKELQFRQLEASAGEDDRCTVIREGNVLRINPTDLVVGDIVSVKVSELTFLTDINIDNTNSSQFPFPLSPLPSPSPLVFHTDWRWHPCRRNPHLRHRREMQRVRPDRRARRPPEELPLRPVLPLLLRGVRHGHQRRREGPLHWHRGQLPVGEDQG